MACRVTRERESDVAENLERFLVRSVHSRGMTYELILTVKMVNKHPLDPRFW